jgi:hypothetical protein
MTIYTENASIIISLKGVDFDTPTRTAKAKPKPRSVIPTTQNPDSDDLFWEKIGVVNVQNWKIQLMGIYSRNKDALNKDVELEPHFSKINNMVANITEKNRNNILSQTATENSVASNMVIPMIFTNNIISVHLANKNVVFEYTTGTNELKLHIDHMHKLLLLFSTETRNILGIMYFFCTEVNKKKGLKFNISFNGSNPSNTYIDTLAEFSHQFKVLYTLAKITITDAVVINITELVQITEITLKKINPVNTSILKIPENLSDIQKANINIILTNVADNDNIVNAEYITNVKLYNDTFSKFNALQEQVIHTLTIMIPDGLKLYINNTGHSTKKGLDHANLYLNCCISLLKMYNEIVTLIKKEPKKEPVVKPKP